MDTTGGAAGGQAQTSASLSRREMLAGAGAIVAAVNASGAIAKSQPGSSGGTVPAVWTTSSQGQFWQPSKTPVTRIPGMGLEDLDVILQSDKTLQKIDGFGGCFHEKGGRAIAALKKADRETVLHELFAAGAGANLGICRTPIGANDLSFDWYSYNETPGDFAMTRFSIERDRRDLIPFVKAAQEARTDLRLWATPWSPPTWMKTNGHYACARAAVPLPGDSTTIKDNGLRQDQLRSEGQDVFIQEEQYFRAYALYFRRFIEEYRKLGMPIEMVMPQNEFNSAQIFPSCTWTPAGLARFIPYLGDELAHTGTDMFFGTLERGDPDLFEKVYADPRVRPLIKGVGAQWAGRQAIPFIHQAHPELKVYQSEQECGVGGPDWHFARYSWSIMKDFMRAGASCYSYWNIANDSGGLSTWGWPQHAMLSVELASGEYSYSPEYYVFKHLSHYLRPGAKRIETLSLAGYDNVLAFKNPDGKIIVVTQNDMSEPMPLNMLIGTENLHAVLPADSFNTFVI